MKMPRITTDNGVLDWSPLVYGILVAITAMLILTGILVWLETRQTKKQQMITATNGALKFLDPMIWVLFQRMEHSTNVDLYGVWRTKYIKAVEAKLHPYIWQECARWQSLPPIEFVFKRTQ